MMNLMIDCFYLIRQNETGVQNKEGEDTGSNDEYVDESTKTESATSEEVDEKHKKGKKVIPKNNIGVDDVASIDNQK